MRGGNGDDARLGFRRDAERAGSTLPGDGLSYAQLKQRYGQLMPAAAPRSSRAWLLMPSLAILAAVIVYVILMR